MSGMQIHTRSEGPVTTIALSGRFDFNSHRLFRDNCERILGDRAVREIKVDLGDVHYLDSSALGMLLLLREKAQGAAKSVSIGNCRDVVRQVLDVANFNRLFTIS